MNWKLRYGVVNLSIGDPLPALENPPERITLPVTDDDGDSSTPTSTGAIENTTEAFRNVTTDSDGDGIFDHLDFFPNSTANSGPCDRIAIQGGDYFESGIEITTDILRIRGVGRGSTIINGDLNGSAVEMLDGVLSVQQFDFVNAQGRAIYESDSRIIANHITVRGNIPGALAVNGDNLELNNSYIYRADCSSVLGEGAGNLIDSDTCGSDAGFLVDAPTGAIGNH